MSWHYLQGRVVESWAASSLDGAPFALLRLMPSVVKSSYQDNKTDTYQGSQSGMMSELLTVALGVDPSMSSAVVFPAKTSAAPGNEPELKGQDLGSGKSLRESSERSAPKASLSKTRLICALKDLLPSSRILPIWGLMRGGVCWGLTPLAHHTSGNVCGLLLPTPTAKLYGYNMGGAKGRIGKMRPSLETLAGGIRNGFREWMMGWPIGWTALEPLETGKFQEWSNWLGKL